MDINCHDCGIFFSIQDKIDTIWRGTNKTFYCPNGHGMSYPKKVETPELDKLRAEIKSLNIKLTAALADVDVKKKKISELELELEIYKPATASSVE